MTEREFVIGTQKFQLSKIDAILQFHIVRRLAPILGDLLPVFAKLQKAQNEGKLDLDNLGEDQIAMFSPAIAGFGKLSDADSEYVLQGLCSAVEVQQEPAKNWAKVAKKGIGFMIQDLEFPVLMQIAGRAFAYNLSGFFAVLPQISHGGASKQKGK